jgi:hypothetical protein
MRQLNIHVLGPGLARVSQLVFHAAGPQLKKYMTLNIAAVDRDPARVNP